MTELDLALAALRDGDLVILPTETVYGLAGDARDSGAVASIFAAKGRPQFNPLISHVASLEMAEQLAEFDDRGRALARAFWPGPLTLVLPVRDPLSVCDLARAGLDSIAIRVPAHPLALALLQAFDGPLVAPSANRSGRPSPTTLTDALDETGSSATLGLEGGPCEVGLESTVVSLMGEARLLRPGRVTRAEIEAVIGPLADDQAEGHRSPGRLTRHYAPQSPVRLEVTSPEAGEAYLGFGPGPETQWNLSPSGNLSEAAANLFSYLRSADKTGPRAIAVAPIPQTGLGEAINDRLKRAAGFVG